MAMVGIEASKHEVTAKLKNSKVGKVGREAGKIDREVDIINLSIKREVEVGGKKFGRTVPITRYISVKLVNNTKLAFRGSDEDKKNHIKAGAPRSLDIFERYFSAQEGPYILGEKVYYKYESLSRLADYPNLTKFVQSFVERPNIKKHFATLSK
ncbi:hypothetical protein BDF21DRAFT_449130 [Thamnidium elegans]|nr:hypothetical protein BDF21DRAFT_449130 [Thamnidium elegans]